MSGPADDSRVAIARLEEKLAALDRLVQEGFKTRDEARTLIVEGMNARLHVMNEFRQALMDQRSEFLTRKEYDIHHDNLIADLKKAESEHEKFVRHDTITALKKQADFSTTKLATWDGRVWAIGIVFVVLQLIVGWDFGGGFKVIGP